MGKGKGQGTQTAATATPPATLVMRLDTWGGLVPLTSLPKQVHSSRLVSEPVAPGEQANTLGHLQWTPEAARYFGSLRPRATRQVEALRATEWWRDSYVRERMAVHLGSRNAAALVDYYQGANYWHVTARHRKGPHWLERLDRKARRLARTWYYPDTTAQGVTIY